MFAKPEATDDLEHFIETDRNKLIFWGVKWVQIIQDKVKVRARVRESLLTDQLSYY